MTVSDYPDWQPKPLATNTHIIVSNNTDISTGTSWTFNLPTDHGAVTALGVGFSCGTVIPLATLRITGSYTRTVYWYSTFDELTYVDPTGQAVVGMMAVVPYSSVLDPGFTVDIIGTKTGTMWIVGYVSAVPPRVPPRLATPQFKQTDVNVAFTEVILLPGDTSYGISLEAVHVSNTDASAATEFTVYDQTTQVPVSHGFVGPYSTVALPAYGVLIQPGRSLAYQQTATVQTIVLIYWRKVYPPFIQYG